MQTTDSETNNSYKNQMKRNNQRAETIQTEQKSRKFGDMLPELLKNNLFDQAITKLRKWTDILNITDGLDNIVYWNSWAALRMIFKIAFKYQTYQASNFPEYGPVLLVANHQSVLDPFLIGSAVPREIRWMSKIQNFEMPVFRSILSFFGTFAVNREENPVVVLDRAVERLNNNECVGMFPAGTRSPTDKINEKFKTGAARIVLRAQVPYVPVAIVGSHSILPKNSVKLKFHKVEIRVGEPTWHDEIWTKEYKREDVSAIRDEMWSKINELMQAEVDPVSKLVITPSSEQGKKNKMIHDFDLSLS
ncbi:MAG: hypothetical protein GF364_08245 [Candidatus Lokiarchaeota archaeon]|nr:hypothetical protein [Candidatus Lokiarchaeota archaeon]